MGTARATKASTLPTRQRTVPKAKPNGTRRQIAKDPEPEVEEAQEQEEEQDDNDAGGGDDDDDAPVTTDEDDGEPLEASQAEVEPAAVVEETPRGRRGRPAGTRKPKGDAAPTNGHDLYGHLFGVSVALRDLAEKAGKTPEQLLSTIGKIIATAQELDA